MACRDGLSNRLVKQYCSTCPGKMWSIWAGNYLVENFGKIKIFQHLTIRFGYPFVQLKLRSHSFRFAKRELPENSLGKVWAPLRLGSWVQNFENPKNWKTWKRPVRIGEIVESWMKILNKWLWFRFDEILRWISLKIQWSITFNQILIEI